MKKRIDYKSKKFVISIVACIALIIALISGTVLFLKSNDNSEAAIDKQVENQSQVQDKESEKGKDDKPNTISDEKISENDKNNSEQDDVGVLGGNKSRLEATTMVEYHQAERVAKENHEISWQPSKYDIAIPASIGVNKTRIKVEKEFTSYIDVSETETDSDSEIIEKIDNSEIGEIEFKGIQKPVTPETKVDLNDVLTYTVTVTNTGTVAVYDVEVVDSIVFDELGNNVVKVIDSILPGESKSVIFEYTVTEEDIIAGSIFNTATGKIPGETPTDPEEPVIVPTEEIDKTVEIQKELTGIQSIKADGTYGVDKELTEKASLKDKLTYTITVTNKGNVTYETVTISDGLADAVLVQGNENVENLKPGESVTLVYEYIVKESDIQNGKVVNTATAQVDEEKPEETEKEVPTDPVDKTVEIQKELTGMQSIKADGTYGVDKELTEKASLKDKLTYTITVTNKGNVTYETVTISDGLADAVLVQGNENVENLKPGESVTLVYEYIVKESDIQNGKVVNTATAQVDEEKPEETEKEVPTDPVDKTVEIQKELTGMQSIKADGTYGVDKELTEKASLKDKLTYTITVTNKGNVTYETVTISDGLADAVLVQGNENVENLKPGESVTLVYEYIVKESDIQNGKVVNTATAQVDEEKPEETEKEVPTDPVDKTVEIQKELTGMQSIKADGTYGVDKELTEKASLKDKLTYTITVTNKGNVTYETVTISDGLADAVLVQGNENVENLKPGESVTLVYEYIVKESDIQNGKVVNTATAQVDEEKPEETEKEVPTDPVDKTVEIQKELTGMQSIKADGTYGVDKELTEKASLKDKLTYTITVTNKGNVTYETVTISDGLADAVLVQGNENVENLKPGESVTLVYEYIVKESDIQNGKVVNTATAQVDEEKPEETEKEVPTDPVDKTVEIQKELTGMQSIKADGTYGVDKELTEKASLKDKLTYTITVTNKGNVTYETVTISDGLADAVLVQGNENVENLKPGESVTLVYEYIVKESDIQNGKVVNTATAQVDEEKPEETEKEVPTDPVDKTVEIQKELTGMQSIKADGTYGVDKELTEKASLKDKLTYTITVTNKGNVTYETVTISDGLADAVLVQGNENVENLKPGESVTLVYEYIVKESDIQNGKVVNTATAQVDEEKPEETEKEVPTDPVDKTVEIQKELTGMQSIKADGTYGVDKELTEKASLKDKLTYTITVTNKGNVTYETVTISDGLADAVLVQGNENVENLKPGESVTLVYEYIVKESDIQNGKVVNTATAQVDEEKPEETEKEVPTDPVDKTVEIQKELTGMQSIKADGTYGVDKELTEKASLKDKLTYTITVTNKGNVTYETVTISDGLADAVLVQGNENVENLKPGESVTLVYEYIVKESDIQNGKVVNTATAQVDEEKPEETEKEVPTDPVDKTVEIQKELTGMQSIKADGTYGVDKELTEKASLKDKLTYTITVTNKGNVTYETVTISDGLADAVLVQGNENVENLKPGESVTLVYEYIVKESDIQNGKVVNTATAQVDEEKPEETEKEVPTDPVDKTVEIQKELTGMQSIKADGTYGVDKELTEKASLKDKLTYTITVTNKGNVTYETVTISDGLADAVLVQGNENVENLKPGESVTLVYEYIVKESDIQNGKVVNTATAQVDEEKPEETEKEVPTDPVDKTVEIQKELTGMQSIKADGTYGVDKELTEKASLKDKLTYTITVTNKGNVTYETVTISDGLADAVLVQGNENVENLKPGESVTLVYEYIVKESDIQNGKVVNTATAQVDEEKPEETEKEVPTDPVDKTVEIQKELTGMQSIKADGTYGVDKELTEKASLKDKLTYTITVTNKGNVTYETVTISDGLADAVLVQGNENVENLKPGESVTLVYEYIVKESDIQNGKVVNTATAQVDEEKPEETEKEVPTDPVDKTVEIQKELTGMQSIKADGTYGVDKELTEKASLKDKLTYTITVTNKGNVTYETVTISDGLADAVLVQGNENVENLKPGESVTLVYEYIVKESDIQNGKVVNTATAQVDEEKPEETEKEVPTDPVDKTVEIQKELTGMQSIKADGTYGVDKELTEKASLKDKLTYTITVTNKGNVTYETVTISDGLADAVLVQGNENVENLKPGESVTLVYEYIVKESDIQNGKVVNTATAQVDEEKPEETEKEVPTNQLVSYTVKYLEKDTNKVLHEAKIVTGNDINDIKVGNSVTENAINISGYVAQEPTSQTITLKATENEIIFYYTEITTAEYTVNYLDKSTNAVIQKPKTGTANIGKTINASNEVISIPGYKYDSATPNSITITLNSTENVINLYYITEKVVNDFVKGNWSPRITGGGETLLNPTYDENTQTFYWKIAADSITLGINYSQVQDPATLQRKGSDEKENMISKQDYTINKGDIIRLKFDGNDYLYVIHVGDASDFATTTNEPAPAAANLLLNTVENEEVIVEEIVTDKDITNSNTDKEDAVVTEPENEVTTPSTNVEDNTTTNTDGENNTTTDNDTTVKDDTTVTTPDETKEPESVTEVPVTPPVSETTPEPVSEPTPAPAPVEPVEEKPEVIVPEIVTEIKEDEVEA